MSVTHYELYCRRCKLRRTYQKNEELPKACPQCQATRDPPPTGWLKQKVAYLPLLAWLIILPISVAYGLLTGARYWWWMLYVMALLFFGLGWLLFCVTLPWPKPHWGPWITPHVRWAGEDADPDETIGHRVLMKLIEGWFDGEFLATIEGYKPNPYNPESKEDRLYVVKLDPDVRRDADAARAIGEGEYLLFHPEAVRDCVGLPEEVMKEYRGLFASKASMEDFLLNPQSIIGGLFGTPYTAEGPSILTKPELQRSDLRRIAWGCDVRKAH